MRIGLWKSGLTGLYFTAAEMTQLGIVLGEKIDVRMAYIARGKGKTAAVTGPVWIINKGNDSLPRRHTVKGFTRKLKKFPELVGHTELKVGYVDDFSRSMFADEVVAQDFATMEAMAEWVPSTESYHVTINKAEAKPASTGRVGSSNGKTTVKNSAIGHLPATASNLVPSRVGALIEKINYIITKNPGTVALFVKKDGTLGAEINVKVKV